MSRSPLDADTFCVCSKLGFSDDSLEEADVGVWGRASVWAGADTSLDAELCTCRGITADVCVVQTGGTALVGAAVVAATDSGVAVVVDAWVVVTTVVVATAMDFSGDDVVVVTVGNGAGVEVVTGGGILTAFSAVVGGVVDVVCSLEGAAAATGIVSWTFSVGDDAVAVTVLDLAVVVTLADVVVGDGLQVGVGTAQVFAEDAPATGTADSCPCVAT